MNSDFTPTQLVALMECRSEGLQSRLQSSRKSTLSKLLRDEGTSARVASRPTSLARWGTRFRGLYKQGNIFPENDAAYLKAGSTHTN